MRDIRRLTLNLIIYSYTPYLLVRVEAPVLIFRLLSLSNIGMGSLRLNYLGKSK